jgi:hypothetical protein
VQDQQLRQAQQITQYLTLSYSHGVGIFFPMFFETSNGNLTITDLTLSNADTEEVGKDLPLVWVRVRWESLSLVRGEGQEEGHNISIRTDSTNERICFYLKI